MKRIGCSGIMLNCSFSDKNLREQTVQSILVIPNMIYGRLWMVVFLDEDEKVILLRSCRLQLKIFIAKV